MLILLLCVITFIITLHVEYCQEHDAILKLKICFVRRLLRSFISLYWRIYSNKTLGELCFNCLGLSVYLLVQIKSRSNYVLHSHLWAKSQTSICVSLNLVLEPNVTEI